MMPMNVEDYLESIRMINGDLERTNGRIQRTEALLGLKGISYDGQCFNRTESFPGDGLTESMVKLMEYREYLDALLEYYIDQEKEADFVLSAIANANRRRAVSLRYMDNMSYGKIAKKMSFGKTTVYELVSSGVDELRPILIPLLQEFKNSERNRTKPNDQS